MASMKTNTPYYIYRACVMSCLVVALTCFAACSVSYKFNGASIDYTQTKTIQIADFPIRSSYVWGTNGTALQQYSQGPICQPDQT